VFETTSKLAENMATGLSRREMLGHCCRGALTMAGVLSGLLVFAGSASAHACPQPYRRSKCPGGGFLCCFKNSHCDTNVEGVSYCTDTFQIG